MFKKLVDASSAFHEHLNATVDFQILNFRKFYYFENMSKIFIELFKQATNNTVRGASAMN